MTENGDMDNDTMLDMNTTEMLQQQKCVPPEKYLQLYGSELEGWLLQILCPVLMAIGIVGNVLNILVLRDKQMKRTYFLFYCVALSDILFFFSLTPAWLASYSCFAQIETFRHMFFTIKTQVNGLANWISAFNIWTVCLISYERWSAVHNPMNQKKLFGFQPKQVVITFVLATFLCTSYLHYEHFCKIRTICHGVQLVQVCMDIRSDWKVWKGVNDTPEWIRHTVGVLRYFHAVIAISLPLVFVIGFNMALIYHANSVGFSFQSSMKQGKKISDGKETYEAENSVSRRHSETTNQQRAEHRITRIAIIIILVEFATNLPSTVVLLYHTVYPVEKSHNNDYTGDEGKTQQLAQDDFARLITSYLTMAGKASNFFIFCMFSENFRKRLWSKLSCGTFVESGSTNSSRRSSRRFNL